MGRGHRAGTLSGPSHGCRIWCCGTNGASEGPQGTGSGCPRPLSSSLDRPVGTFWGQWLPFGAEAGFRPLGSPFWGIRLRLRRQVPKIPTTASTLQKSRQMRREPRGQVGEGRPGVSSKSVRSQSSWPLLSRGLPGSQVPASSMAPTLAWIGTCFWNKHLLPGWGAHLSNTGYPPPLSPRYSVSRRTRIILSSVCLFDV